MANDETHKTKTKLLTNEHLQQQTYMNNCYMWPENEYICIGFYCAHINTMKKKSTHTHTYIYTHYSQIKYYDVKYVHFFFCLIKQNNNQKNCDEIFTLCFLVTFHWLIKFVCFFPYVQCPFLGVETISRCATRIYMYGTVHSLVPLNVVTITFYHFFLSFSYTF